MNCEQRRESDEQRTKEAKLQVHPAPRSPLFADLGEGPNPQRAEPRTNEASLDPEQCDFCFPSKCDCPHKLAHAAEARSDSARTNGGIRCDVTSGPCACGAWHSQEDVEPPVGSRLWRCEQELAKARAQLQTIRTSVTEAPFPKGMYLIDKGHVDAIYAPVPRTEPARSDIVNELRGLQSLVERLGKTVEHQPRGRSTVDTSELTNLLAFVTMPSSIQNLEARRESALREITDAEDFENTRKLVRELTSLRKVAEAAEDLLVDIKVKHQAFWRTKELHDALADLVDEPISAPGVHVKTASGRRVAFEAPTSEPESVSTAGDAALNDAFASGWDDAIQTVRRILDEYTTRPAVPSSSGGGQ